MSDWKERLLQERKELDDKLVKFRYFLKTDEFMNLDYRDKVLLRKQNHAMTEYLDILAQRIANAK